MEIALIAHDGKKAEMVNFLMKHKDALNKNNITDEGLLYLRKPPQSLYHHRLLHNEILPGYLPLLSHKPDLHPQKK